MSPVGDVVARLLVDPWARRLFQDTPEELAAAYSLTAENLAQLAGLDVDALEFAAGAVGRKRLSRLSEAYPWTVSALRLAPPGGVLTSFLAQHPPLAGRTRWSALAAERERFRRFVSRMATVPEFAFVGDLLRFEEIRRRLTLDFRAGLASRPAQAAACPSDRLLDLHPRLEEHAAVEHFEWDVMSMGAGLSSSTPRLEPTRGPVWLLMCRPDRDSNVKVYRLGAPSASVLLLCDGSRSVEGIVAAAADGPGNVRREVALATVERGCDAGALLLTLPR